MTTYIIFGVLSIPVIVISWRTMFNLKSHGFYRFLSWECILWLFANNYKFWFQDPLRLPQIISWLLLILSGYVVIAGVVLMKKIGKPRASGERKNLYKFEQTTKLITTGIFRYIRHPLYASLLYLTWGIFFKQPDYFLLAISIFSTGFLILTAYFDERECLNIFGEPYRLYMKQSKRFIPYFF